jgi:toxin ParE1/3/4
MIWKVEYTDDANQDLQDIYDYIADVLLEPTTAANQTDRIMDAVDSIEHMPLRHRLYDRDPWRSKGLRVMPVGNYLAFYLPVESVGIVSIIRIMYGGRDIETHLGAPDE